MYKHATIREITDTAMRLRAEGGLSPPDAAGSAMYLHGIRITSRNTRLLHRIVIGNIRILEARTQTKNTTQKEGEQKEAAPGAVTPEGGGMKKNNARLL